jgi:hypothetical protein
MKAARHGTAASAFGMDAPKCRGDLSVREGVSGR